jgi:hypothetical protein
MKARAVAHLPAMVLSLSSEVRQVRTPWRARTQAALQLPGPARRFVRTASGKLCPVAAVIPRTEHANDPGFNSDSAAVLSDPGGLRCGESAADRRTGNPRAHQLRLLFCAAVDAVPQHGNSARGREFQRPLRPGLPGRGSRCESFGHGSRPLGVPLPAERAGDPGHCRLVRQHCLHRSAHCARHLRGRRRAADGAADRGGEWHHHAFHDGAAGHRGGPGPASCGVHQSPRRWRSCAILLSCQCWQGRQQRCSA